MRKIICGREYDTETATLIKKFISGVYGQADGYEESLYQTPDGLYFLFVNGGDASIYPKADILRIAKTKVNTWLESH